MSGAHTPGPWLRTGLTIYTLRPCKWLGADSFENAWSALVQPDGQHKTPAEELEANARLIAAAPELLAVLEAMFVDGGVQIMFAGNPNACEALEAQARATLAKARGAA